MSILSTLVIKIFPLYVVMFLGYIVGVLFKIKKESIAPILIYIITPVVVFNAIVSMNIQIKDISLPLLYFIPACIMCLLFYKIGGFFLKGSEKNIVAYAAGTGNTGYFGLPLILAFYDPTYFNIAVFISLGGILYESTVGFFIVAQGQFSTKKAIKKVLTLPTIYACILAVIAQTYNLHISKNISDMMINFNGAYIVFGMMMVGISLSEIKKTSLDKSFTTLACLAKLFVLPALITCLVLLDTHVFHIYDSVVHTVLLIMAIVPIASNTVVLASLFDCHPDKMSVTVLVSTICALVYIPLFVGFLFPLIL